MYITQNNLNGSVNSVWSNTNNIAIPIDPANRHYQRILDDIIEQGADCFEGDIPTDLQTAADAKQFAKQVEDYTEAKARISQYQLSVGRPETSYEEVISQEWDEELMEMQDVTETIVTPAIEPLDATVEVTTQELDQEPVTTTIDNPLIVTDDAERDAAQLIIDNTPQEVKDQVDGV